MPDHERNLTSGLMCMWCACGVCVCVCVCVVVLGQRQRLPGRAGAGWQPSRGHAAMERLIGCVLPRPAGVLYIYIYIWHPNPWVISPGPSALLSIYIYIYIYIRLIYTDIQVWSQQPLHQALRDLTSLLVPFPLSDPSPSTASSEGSEKNPHSYVMCQVVECGYCNYEGEGSEKQRNSGIGGFPPCLGLTHGLMAQLQDVIEAYVSDSLGMSVHRYIYIYML